MSSVGVWTEMDGDGEYNIFNDTDVISGILSPGVTSRSNHNQLRSNTDLNNL